jgi:hypothetical protein
MIRGTTAQFNFKLPYNKNDVKTAEVVFWQPGNNVGLKQDYPLPIKKEYEVSSYALEIVGYDSWSWVDDYTLSVKLSQQETLTFSDKYKAIVQLRGATIDGIVFASPQEYIVVYPIHGDEPMGDTTNPDNPGLTPTEDGWYILDGGLVNQGGE